MLNQYADCGLQDFQYPPAHHAPESGPDVATLFSGLNLRQNHLDDQNRMLLEVNAKLQSLIDSLDSTQSSTQPAPSIPTHGIRAGIRGRPKQVTSVSTGTDASPHESSTESGSPTPSNAAPKHSPSLGVPAALSPAQRKMRLDLKRYVGTTFRNVCGVGVNECPAYQRGDGRGLSNTQLCGRGHRCGQHPYLCCGC
ncbi:hypothetical protein FB451DRAFT_1567330 [Mycena latifolia]|nr:hypothetical protein FB451DRAFT_1567330 [Mycena latifolia]